MPLFQERYFILGFSDRSIDTSCVGFLITFELNNSFLKSRKLCCWALFLHFLAHAGTLAHPLASDSPAAFRLIRTINTAAMLFFETAAVFLFRDSRSGNSVPNF